MVISNNLVKNFKKFFIKFNNKKENNTQPMINILHKRPERIRI